MDRTNIINRPIVPNIGQNQPIRNSQADKKPSAAFNELLKQETSKLKELKFSKHAESRLISRNIDITEDQLASVVEAVNKAETKGVKDSLIIMKNMALIVNVPTRTIITAMDEKSMRDNIFTNIDGAVII